MSLLLKAWRGLVLGAGALVLAVVVAHEGGGRIVAMLWQIGWGFVALTALRAGYVALRAGALFQAAPPSTLSYRELWWIRLSTEAVEMITLTGPFLAEPAKGWLLKKRGLSTAESVGLVMLEYLLYTMVTTWMAGIGLAVLLERHALPPAFRGVVVGILAVVAIATVAFAYATASGVGLIAPSMRRIVGGPGRRFAMLVERLDAAERVLVAFLKGNRRGLVTILVLESVAQVLLMLEVWVVFRALGTGSTLGDAFLFEGAVKFIDVAFFFVPGQLGAHEALYGAVASSLGVVPAVGVTLSLARRIRGLLVGSAAAFARLDLAK